MFLAKKDFGIPDFWDPQTRWSRVVVGVIDDGIFLSPWISTISDGRESTLLIKSEQCFHVSFDTEATMRSYFSSMSNKILGQALYISRQSQ